MPCVKSAIAFRLAGYGWIAGWVFQCLWQFCFLLQSDTGMWLCFVALLGACIAFELAAVKVHRRKEVGECCYA